MLSKKSTKHTFIMFSTCLGGISEYTDKKQLQKYAKVNFKINQHLKLNHFVDIEIT